MASFLYPSVALSCAATAERPPAALTPFPFLFGFGLLLDGFHLGTDFLLLQFPQSGFILGPLQPELQTDAQEADYADRDIFRPGIGFQVLCGLKIKKQI